MVELRVSKTDPVTQQFVKYWRNWICGINLQGNESFIFFFFLCDSAQVLKI